MIRNFIIIFLCSFSLEATGMPEEYYTIKHKIAMKQYFFNYMSIIANKQNNLILNDRNFVKSFFSKLNKANKNSQDYKRFISIQKRYKLKEKDKLSKYLYHIDIIPTSLVLAQAAVESGWGKSRFVKNANNIFGQWTWKAKGLVPKNRDSGAKHRIKIFDSLEMAVKDYMFNLNIGWGYKKLRDLRAKIRKYGAPLTGLSLSKTLINYSQKKEEYTKILATIILANNLKRFEK